MKTQYGLLINLNKCTGCNACIVACKQEFDLPPRMDALPGSSGFSFIRVACIGPVGEYPLLSMHYQPILCMHCADPPCVESCPVEAIYKQTNGLVLIDKEACTGCAECLSACPYDVICLDGDQEVARKCDLCEHRIEQGHTPACAAACNAGAMTFGDLGDEKSDISRSRAEAGKDCFVELIFRDTCTLAGSMKERVDTACGIVRGLVDQARS